MLPLTFIYKYILARIDRNSNQYKNGKQDRFIETGREIKQKMVRNKAIHSEKCTNLISKKFEVWTVIYVYLFVSVSYMCVYSIVFL